MENQDRLQGAAMVDQGDAPPTVVHQNVQDRVQHIQNLQQFQALNLNQV